MLQPRSIVSLALGVVVGGTFASGVATAATSSRAQVKTCVTTKTGAIRIAAKCHRGEAPLALAKGGVRGPAGTTGARGATGPAGAAGATGATGATGARGPAGAPGADGGTGSAGPVGLLYASVASDGSLVDGSPGVTSSLAAGGGPPIYRVIFARDVAHCAAVASVAGLPDHARGGYTGFSPGFAVTVHEASDPSHPAPSPEVDVSLYDAANANNTQANSFSLLVSCPAS